MLGTVKCFFPLKGFGFLKLDDQQPDIFFHVKEAQKIGVMEPKIGDRFSFESGEGKNGRPCAVNLAKI